MEAGRDRVGGKASVPVMVSFVGFVQCFIGIGVWLLLSEIFPMAIRGFAMGIAVFVLWTVNATISQVFPQLVEAAGATATFALFVVINIGSRHPHACLTPPARVVRPQATDIDDDAASGLVPGVFGAPRSWASPRMGAAGARPNPA